MVSQSPSHVVAEGVDWLKVLWERSPAGIYLTDPAGRVLWVNRKWCDLTGRSLESAMGDGWRDAIHPDDRERIDREWTTPSADRGAFVSEYRYLRPDGAVIRILGRATEYTDADGNLLGFIGVTMDFPEAKQARKSVRAVAKLESKLDEESPALSKREREVAGLLADGNSNKQVAKRLGISVRTAEAHRARIMRKLRLGSLASLVRYAIQSGLSAK